MEELNINSATIGAPNTSILQQRTRVTQDDIDSTLLASTWSVSKIGQKTTVALLTLPSGFEIVGTSACVDPANYNEDIGSDIAKRRCIDKLWAINGVFFEYELWEKVVDNKLTSKEILALQNIEQRMIALKLRGAEQLLTELDAKSINKSARGNELFLLKDVFSIPAYFLKYTDPSTGRVYVSGIDPEVGIEADADAAMAWKFQLTAEEYAELRHEA